MNSRVADTVLPPVICAADPELPDPASPSVASFAFFERVTKPHPTKVVSIDELVRDIVGGRWAEPVRHIRACSAKADADRLKVRTLPSIKVSGQFRDRTAGSLIGHSGLLCLDFDFLGSHLAEFKGRIIQDPHVCAAFVSPRGHGLKVIVAVDATCADTHRRCFEAARRYFTPWLPPGAELDPLPSNVASNCFVSHDPEAWSATGHRVRFEPATLERGCRIDISHDVESLEKEPSSFSSSSDTEEQDQEEAASLVSGSRPQPHLPPLPSVIELPGVVGSRIWRDWVEPQRHQPERRNAVIVGRVPILLNLVGPEAVALLLLQWYRHAPAGMFKDNERTHWRETWAHINACVISWPTHKSQFSLSDLERTKYAALGTERQRHAFRICRSLSLAKSNITTRTFFLSGQDCADRLLIPAKAGERQLEYLAKAGVIEIACAGATWSRGKAPAATRYRWCF